LPWLREIRDPRELRSILAELNKARSLKAFLSRVVRG